MAPSKSGQFRVVSDAPGTVSVSGVLSFATAANALAAIRGAFTGSDHRALDLSGVTCCDSAGLACVLAALAEADQSGRRVAVHHAPEGMQALAQVCGVEPFLR